MDAAPLAQALCAEPRVAAAVAGAIAAGASRQTAAAVAAAAVRALGGAPVVDEELAERLCAVTPVLAERVAAGAAGRPPCVTGAARLRRNVAEHVGFGDGPEVLRQGVAELRRRQRGGRRGARGDKASVRGYDHENNGAYDDSVNGGYDNKDSDRAIKASDCDTSVSGALNDEAGDFAPW